MFRNMFYFLLLLLVTKLILINTTTLKEPTTYYLTNNTRYNLSLSQCNITVGLNTVSTRCWCFNDDCSVPGPTLVMYNGSRYQFLVINKLRGNYNETYHNQYHNPDVFNFHTHGLHISPDEDNQFITVKPQSSQLYNVTIVSNHYPGIHWYHTHSHGSTSLQMQGGAFGAIIIKYSNENSILDYNLVNMKQHVIMYHWMHLHNTTNCTCSNYQSLAYTSGNFQIFPYCFEWCSMPSLQRTQSSVPYSVKGPNNKKYFLVNGQQNPTINMIQGEYQMFRMVGALSQHYVQLKFDNTSCSYYLLSKDGIYFEKKERNLCASPYYCYLLLAPGNRADVAIKCNKAGTYVIKSSTTNLYSFLTNFPRFDNNVSLFTLNVTSNNSITSSYISSLPKTYPTYPTYLNSLLHEDNESILEYSFYNTCTCVNYDSSTLVSPLNANDRCGYQFGGSSGSVINGLAFNSSKPLSYVLSNTIYEWYVFAHYHPFHQHVNPFQVTEDVGYGFIAQKGDRQDTIGASTNYTIRTINLDFTGNVLVHCHTLPHEDTGMMAYYTIVDSSPSSCATNPPTNVPTKFPTGVPTKFPTGVPTKFPTGVPTKFPTSVPTSLPTGVPTKFPTGVPTKFPTSVPTSLPTGVPTKFPTGVPSKFPTGVPTKFPTGIPTKFPTGVPTKFPTGVPTKFPTDVPTNLPTRRVA